MFFSILISPNICTLFIQTIAKATNVPDMWAKPRMEEMQEHHGNKAFPVFSEQFY